MNLLGNYSPVAIENVKREVAEYYKTNGDGFMPKDFEAFFILTNHIDIKLLKRAAASISDERQYMSNTVNDICFTIESLYQRYYNLDENDWGLVS